MAKETKSKKKRKPAAITGAGIKIVKSIAKEAAKAGKRMSYGGKMTKAAKDIKIIKAVTDPADKMAIKAAKSSQNIKKIKAKADSKELKRGIKASRKDAGKAKAAIKAKNKVIDAKNTVRRQSMERTSKQNALKDILRGKQASRASQKEFNAKAMAAQKNEKRLPPVIKNKVKAAPLKPVTKRNIKKVESKSSSVVPPVIKKAKKKMSPRAKAAAGVAGVVAGGVALQRSGDKSKAKPVEDKKVNDSSRGNITKKEGDLKSNVKSVKNNGSSRNDFNKKGGKSKGNALKNSSESVNGLIDEVLTGKDGKKQEISSNSRQIIADKMNKKIKKMKADNIPWDKILESITMLLSSHILSRGISKRYK